MSIRDLELSIAEKSTNAVNKKAPLVDYARRRSNQTNHIKEEQKGEVNGMKDIIKRTISVIIIVAGLSMTILLGLSMAINKISESNDDSWEKHHDIQISVYDVRERLKGISELMTYAYEYSGTAAISDCRKTLIFGWDVPLTKHEINMTYAGLIKVGYNLEDTKVFVDNKKKEIIITLGEQICENNLPEESVNTIEKNNILNLIRADEVTNRLADIKEEEYKKAVEEGILKKAEDRAKAIIEEGLSDIDGYKVRFGK